MKIKHASSVKQRRICKKIDVNLVNQFKNSLSDLKAGKIKRVA